jgi:hypothetical protein
MIHGKEPRRGSILDLSKIQFITEIRKGLDWVGNLQLSIYSLHYISLKLFLYFGIMTYKQDNKEDDHLCTCFRPSYFLKKRPVIILVINKLNRIAHADFSASNVTCLCYAVLREI